MKYRSRYIVTESFRRLDRCQPQWEFIFFTRFPESSRLDTQIRWTALFLSLFQHQTLFGHFYPYVFFLIFSLREISLSGENPIRMRGIDSVFYFYLFEGKWPAQTGTGGCFHMCIREYQNKKRIGFQKKNNVCGLEFRCNRSFAAESSKTIGAVVFSAFETLYIANSNWILSIYYYVIVRNAALSYIPIAHIILWTSPRELARRSCLFSFTAGFVEKREIKWKRWRIRVAGGLKIALSPWLRFISCPVMWGSCQVQRSSCRYVNRVNLPHTNRSSWFIFPILIGNWLLIASYWLNAENKAAAIFFRSIFGFATSKWQFRLGIWADARRNVHASLLIIFYSILQLNGNDTFAVCGVCRTLGTYTYLFCEAYPMGDASIEQIIVESYSETKLCYKKQLNLIEQFKYVQRQQQLGWILPEQCSQWCRLKICVCGWKTFHFNLGEW